MGRKKKGSKKPDENAGGDASTSREETSRVAVPAQADRGAGDAAQSSETSQGTRQQPREPQRPSHVETQPQQQGQNVWQLRAEQQRSSSVKTQPQQQGKGPRQTKGKQEEHRATPVDTQQGPSSWQPKDKQQQQPYQQMTPLMETYSQPPLQGAWSKKTQQTHDQQRTSAGDQYSHQGQPIGKQQQQYVMQSTATPETQFHQQSQGAWQQKRGGREPQQQVQQRAQYQQGGQGQGRTSQQQVQQGTQYQQGSQGREPQQQMQQRTQYQQGGQGRGREPQQQMQQRTQYQQGGQGRGREPQQQVQQRTQYQQHQSQVQQSRDHSTSSSQGSQQGAWQAGDRQRSQRQEYSHQQQQGAWKSAGAQQSQPASRSSVTSVSAPTQEFEKMSLQSIGGTAGRRIQVETNHLAIDFGKLLVAYHYDVQITPDTPKRWLRDVFEQFRKKNFPKSHPAFDGRRNMYSPFELLSSRAEISDEIELTMPLESKSKTYKVVVKLATTVDLSPLRNMRVNSSQQALQCVEIVLRNASSMKCIQAGRSFYTKPPSIIDLGEGCEMYYGHYQTVVRGWKPFFNIDVAHKAFPKKMNVVDLIAELSSDWKNKVVASDLRNTEIQNNVLTKVNKHIKGLRISYEIPGIPSSRREYRVNGTEMCPRKKTFAVDNRNMTIEQYFQEKKNYRLCFPLLPTIWVGSATRQDKILLPAELCTVIEGQAINRKMTDNQTSAMIKQAATSTEIRKKKIMSSLQKTNHNADACMREFGFTINAEFEKIEARVLNPPVLEYGGGAPCRVSKGTWRQDNNKFLRGAELNSWIIISTCGNLNRECQNLANLISNHGNQMGMRLAARPGNFDCLTGWPVQKDINNILQKYSKQFDLIFVIINDSGPIYSYVKKAAEITLNCLTQCIKKRTLTRMNASTVCNILLKVNSKLNGTNHCLKVRPPLLNEPCMIMGADVTHPSPDSKGVPSVVAVTASHDPTAMFGYNMCCRLQLPTVEIIEDLEEITREHLLYFYSKNRGQKPYRIIFFRDGVSEGQFAEVKQVELTAIRKACSNIEKGYEPKITFIVVQKRHHTRFFPQSRDSEDRNINVPAGTCVDTMITNPNVQDFYLVSHASIQGVAKPTKYSTLWDDNDMSYDDVEQLAYYLCHLFSRCNRSVSYPAPTYYAHLGAARAKVYIENDPINLQNLKHEQKKLKNDVIRKEKPMFFV